MNNLLTISCPCLFGLESILSFEVKKIGGTDVVVTDGRVTFKGDASMIAKASLWLRTAERVQIILGSFEAKTFDQLFEGVAALNLEDFIGPDDAFPVKGWSVNSQLFSISDCQSIIKKAAVKRLSSKYGISWFEETGDVYQLQFSIHKDIATIMIDTTGSGLHKRGYRRISNEAPIKETLAAGIIDLARIRSDSVVFDPMCGSGTFLIESAMHAMNIAPGLRRRFVCEDWAMFDNNIFKTARSEAMDAVKRDASFMAYGSDCDENSVRLTLENAKIAGIPKRIKAIKADISEFKVTEPKAVVFCNPPYGERMLEVQEAEELYRLMGKVFERRNGLNYYIISAHEEFEKKFGRKADKRRKLYNGMIRCQLFMYFK